MEKKNHFEKEKKSKFLRPRKLASFRKYQVFFPRFFFVSYVEKELEGGIEILKIKSSKRLGKRGAGEILFNGQVLKTTRTARNYICKINPKGEEGAQKIKVLFG